MQEPAGGLQREQKWRWPVIALLVMTAVPLLPPLRMLALVEPVLLLLMPLLAVCAVLGWRAGGSALLAVIWLSLAIWVVLATPIPAQAAHFERLARGWALLLAAAFGLVAVVAPQKDFLFRALTSVVLALCVGMIVVIATGGSGSDLIELVTAEMVARNEQFVRTYQGQLSVDGPLRQLVETNASFATLSGELPGRMQALAVRAAGVFPALLALQSLAVLALAWSLYHRLSRVRVGPPLPALSEFTFDDQLIWGVLAGVSLLLLPGSEGVAQAGWILVVFFSGLYVVRGLAVVAWLVKGRSRWLMAMTVIMILALPQLAVAALLGVGIGDTWADWRHRAPSST